MSNNEFQSSIVVSRPVFSNHHTEMNTNTHGESSSSSNQMPLAYQRVHRVTIEENTHEDDDLGSFNGWRNQYECTLKRRAIRKREDIGRVPTPTPEIHIIHSSSSTTLDPPPIILSPEFKQYLNRIGMMDGSSSNDSSSLVAFATQEEIEGDTSLGMKLTILGGKVIVQNIMPLEDGRASPAQLTGLISRGDVLVAVDGKSLLGLGGDIEQLVHRLKPLSSPMDDMGTFQRYVTLRLDIGSGFRYLEREEQQQQQQLQQNIERQSSSTERIDAAEDLFNLSKFTFVDQMSGIPLYEDTNATTESITSEVHHLGGDDDDDMYSQDIDDPLIDDNVQGSHDRRILDIRGMISRTVAKEVDLLRTMRSSAFFTMEDTYSTILRQEISRSIRVHRMSQIQTLQDTLLRINDNQLVGIGDELIHKAQINYVEIEKQLTNNNVPPWGVSVYKQALWKLYQDGIKQGSSNSKDDHEDDIIRRFQYLHDEDILNIFETNHLWKDQLLKSIQSKWLHKYSSDVVISPKPNKESSHGGIITGHLYHLLFTSQDSKTALDVKISYYPPADLTFSIYTIVRQVSPLLYPLDGVQSEDSKHSKNEHQVLFQSNLVQDYLLEDIIPSWLHTFDPVKTENRKLVFPITKDTYSNAAPSPKGKKVLSKTSKGSSTIDNCELEPNVRHQTCYLITFLFRNKIVRDYHQSLESGEEKESVAKKFIEKYGAYLNLRESLKSVQALNADLILSTLLEIAQYDPNHVNSLKNLTRRVSDVVYDPQMLSAIYSYLKGGKYDVQPTKNLLIMAFPDIHPYQVRQLLPVNQKDGDLYYEYLSSLMDQKTGLTVIQRDPILVREWCILSVSSRRIGSNNNFSKVASKALGCSTCYHRDLSFLLETSVNLKRWDISLDLCIEIIDHTLYSQYDATLVAKSIRSIATDAIKKDLEDECKQDSAFTHFIPMLQLYHNIQNSPAEKWRHAVVIKNELSNLFYLCCTISKGTTGTEISFLMLISKAFPYETLEILSEWDELKLDDITGQVLFQIIQRCVKFGLEEDWGQKSLSLLETLSNSKIGKDAGNSHGHLKLGNLYPKKESLWDQVLQGKAIINK